MSVLLRAPAETLPRMALARLAPRAAVAARPAAMDAVTASRAVSAARPAVTAMRRTPWSLPAAGRPEGVAVGLALSGTALAEAPLALAMRAAALSVAEGLAVTVAWRRGAVHRELGDRPCRRVGLDARQRSPDQAAVQADLRVG